MKTTEHPPPPSCHVAQPPLPIREQKERGLEPRIEECHGKRDAVRRRREEVNGNRDFGRWRPGRKEDEANGGHQGRARDIKPEPDIRHMAATGGGSLF